MNSSPREAIIGLSIAILFLAVIIIGIGLLLNDADVKAMLWIILFITYALFLFFLLEPGILRKRVKRPIPKEVIKIVEKPIIKEVEKVVYPAPAKKAKAKIPKYAYVASSLTKTYHKANCRLGKSIKRAYKEYSNSASYFKKRKYKPCKFCITKEVKV